MRESHNEITPPRAGPSAEPQKLGRLARSRKRCCRCLKRIRLPPWIKRPLFLLYSWTGGGFTYALLIIVVYTTLMSLQPSLCLPPICRRIAVPVLTQTANVSDMVTAVPDIVTIPEDPNTPPGLPSGFTVGLQCKQGEALSVLIFYAFGFVVGEVMELMHLPGLFGMLLGGLVLRNIGTLFISETIYHQSTVPNGSYPISATNNIIPDDIAEFAATDPRTQIAALLLVNPSLSGVLRQLALATILTRAGLGLDPGTLKQVCGSVFRLAIIPCLTEAATLTLVTRFLIGWPWSWGAILGFVCAAVSPAVIVPNMMRLEVAGWGVAEGIPTLVVAASSLDDVLAITGFGVALAVALSTGENLAATVFWGPGEALCGAAFGACVGFLLCLFPPPKLEHSHLIRGIILICLAVTGLVGSVGLHLPGAGALACLTLAFVVAMGWRSGFPWRLMQSYELYVGNSSHDDSTTGLNSSPSSTRAVDPQTPVVIDHTMSNPLDPSTSGKPSERASNRLELMSKPTKRGEIENLPTMPKLESAPRIQRHKDSTSSSILETLIEYHPHYCSILKQQYTNQFLRKNVSQTPSLRGSCRSKTSIKQLTGGDLPAIAVAVAATAGSGAERSETGYIQTGQPISFRGRSRASRRFSLPEPTAHYEMESFSLSGSFHRGVSPPSGRSSGRKGLNYHRHRLLSPTFREQYAAVCNLPVDKLEELSEGEDDSGGHVQPVPSYGINEQNSNVKVDQNQPGPEYATPLPATPQERGLACLHSMRQTLAAVWWFVQPILFSLIGAEVNFKTLRGASTGRGVACLLIAVSFRLAATILAVLPSKLNMRERLFVAFSWLPKATVQAAIGPVALDTARQLHSSVEIIGYGEVVLTLAAMSIILTAPLGAILMPVTAPYLLHQDIHASEVMVVGTHQTTSTKRSTAGLSKTPDQATSVTNAPLSNIGMVKSDATPAFIPQQNTDGAGMREPHV